MDLVHLNDVHIGCLRSGGTTPETALLLRKRLLNGLLDLLYMADDCNLIINGDLFDTQNVPLSDLFAALNLFRHWLTRNTGSVYLVPGNHDLAKNSEIFSSFDFLALALQWQFEDRVFIPRVATRIDDFILKDSWIVPHMPNQDLFELELAKVPECNYLFLHCNYDSGFAAKSDHSLNLSAAKAEALPAKCIVIAHEHQQKVALGGKVVVVGNQIPSSVADCLGNDTKNLLVIDEHLHTHFKQTWSCNSGYREFDWTNLVDWTGYEFDFIRVVGNATAAQAADVVATISKFRQKSKALVITNAVKIDGHDVAEMEVSLEQIKGFNIMQELLDYLDEDQREVVSKLMEKENNV